MPVAFSELLLAFEFISSDPVFGNSAWVNRETGTVHWRSDEDPELSEGPEDIDDDEKYVELPGPRDLDLGKPLVMRFAADELQRSLRRDRGHLLPQGRLSPLQGFPHPGRRPRALVRLRERGEGKGAARMVRGQWDRGRGVGGALSFPRTRESRAAAARDRRRWMPACAGMTAEREAAVLASPRRRQAPSALLRFVRPAG